MTGYSWTISSGGTITSGLGTNSILVNWNTVGAQTISVGYTDLNSCITLNPTVFNVTVTPLPTATISGTTSVCLNAASPLVTFTGSSATAPYIFTYNINGGANQQVTSIGNSATVDAPTNTVGLLTYNLVSVQDGSSTACSQLQTGNAIITVNPLPTATIAGTNTVCQNSTSPLVIFTGNSTTPPYTFTYSINGGANQLVTTSIGNTVTVAAPTNLVGTFNYNLISVSDGSSTTCSQLQSGNAIVTVNPLPTATIAGTTSVCQNSASPLVTFTGSSSTPPYTFTYNINGGANHQVTSVGNSVSVAAPTNVLGIFTYNLLSVQDGSATLCSQLQNGSAIITIDSLPAPIISGLSAVCQNSTETYSTGPNMTNYVWSVSGGGIITSGSLTNSITISWPVLGTNTIAVNYHNANGCTATVPSTYQVIVNILPTPTFLKGLSTICSGNSSTYTTQSGMINYIWTVTAGGTITSGGGLADDSVTVTWNTTGPQAVSVNYSIGLGCTAAMPTVMNVNVKPRPSVTNPANSTICSGGSSNIVLQASLLGTTFSWTATGSSGNVSGYSASGGPIISQTLINSGFSLETVTYTVTPSLNGCDGPVASFIVTVDPVADAYFNPNGQTFCSGGTSSISILSHVAGATFTYTARGSSGNITGYGPGTTSSIAQTLANIGTGPETVTYNVSPSFNSCPGTADSVKIIVNPLPAVSYTLCNDAITTTAAQPFKLKGGLPLGGTYSGTGVTAGTFNPSVGIGNHTITYSYLNTWGCASNATQVISVINVPVFACDNLMTDIRDNAQYPTIKIGSQCWMAANLNYGSFISSAQMQRDNCIPEKYCFNDNLANCTALGGLYQWDELMQYDNIAAAQGFCPPGWHIPIENEWTTLFNSYISNGFAGSPLKSTGYSGFNALLGGAWFNNVNWNFGNFAVMFWSSSSEGITKAWAHGMNTYNPSVSYYPASRTNALTLRCIKD